jgi:UDP-glucuronate 4-epimerase
VIQNAKILVTGATGQVARPIAERLAKRNEVWAGARFTDPSSREGLEAAGVKTFLWDLDQEDLSGVPSDVDYVIHSACNIFPVANDFDAAIRVNAEGTGALMTRCKNAKAFLYISSLCVYRASSDPYHVYVERESPLGQTPSYAPSYGVSKISTEAVVRTLARIYRLPTTIARLGMAYGAAAHGGVPSIVFRKMLQGEELQCPPSPSFNSMIHEDDFVAQAELLLGAATVPATIVNWTGDDYTDERELYEYIGRISGVTPKIVIDKDVAYAGGRASSAARRAITGPSRVGWTEGVLKSLRTNFPEHRFVAVE